MHESPIGSTYFKMIDEPKQITYWAAASSSEEALQIVKNQMDAATPYLDTIYPDKAAANSRIARYGGILFRVSVNVSDTRLWHL